MPALPWLTGGGYEDWYLVEDFTALGELADAATGSVHGAAHDAAASGFDSGSAGLYALEAGDWRRSLEDAVATWSGRDGLRPGDDRTATSWRRQLVLSPAPEMCTTTGRVEVQTAQGFTYQREAL